MRLFSILMVSLLGAQCLQAQQGTVIYEERIQDDVEVPQDLRMYRDHIDMEAVNSHRLIFDGSTALMTWLPAEEEQLEIPSSGFHLSIHPMPEEKAKTYVDRGSRLFVRQQDFMDRTFLVEDTLRRVSWRLTGERASFLGYLTMQALATLDDSTTVEAWFTPQIPASVGPAGFGDLPGLILMLSEDGGRRSYVAQQIDVGEVDGELRAPTAGRRMGRAEFLELVEQRLRESYIAPEFHNRYTPRL